ncbi:MAG TPA: PhnD/SsuA/transferrin family substrate-binding protein, partial [Burkholderiales bacterium]|nr:PhnD/SsuA/transferrin family substrate-binding protein [Burkholderiales bacterium]
MKYRTLQLLTRIGVVGGLIALPANAAETGKDAGTAKSTKTAFATQDKLANPAGPLNAARAADPDALIFTSAPRETVADGTKIYGPVAEYLSKALGKKVVYRHPGTWGAYRSEMLRGDYDIIFDGP